MSYCETKKEDDRFTKSVVCGELIFWMAEVLDSVPKEHQERLVNEIVGSRITASAPQSNDISRAYGIAVQIGETR